MTLPTMDDLTAEGRAIGLRVDVNSPLMDDGSIADDARLQAHIDTISSLTDLKARVAILAHQGRPGGDDFTTLRDHATRLDELLEASVGYCDATFTREARERIEALDPGEVVVLENTRFYSEEYMEFEPARAAQTHLVQGLIPALDAFVNDAFAAAHRSQPSLVGFPEVLPAYAGTVMQRELSVLGDIEATARPRLYVFGGAKVADAVDVIDHVCDHGLADAILTTGLIGNLFLAEDGVNLGTASKDILGDRVSESTRATVREILRDHRDVLRVPSDVALADGEDRVEVPVSSLPPTVDGPCGDVGSETIEAYESELADARTAVLNGPAGIYETPALATGTKRIFSAVADVEYSIVGGGDSAAAIRTFEMEGFDHISTGGGAALRMLSNDSLPAVEALR